jgi:hypothetical protein
MPPTPIYQIRLQAIVASADAVNPLDLISVLHLIDGVNAYYQQVGFNFLYDPMKDYEFDANSPLAAADDNPTAAQLRQARAALYQGKVVVFFRDGGGGLSGPGPYVLCRTSGGFLIGHVSHELGHYFGLSHVHPESWRLSKQQYFPDPADQPWAGTYFDQFVAMNSSQYPPSNTGLSESELFALETAVQQVLLATFDGDAQSVPNPVSDTGATMAEWPPLAKDVSGNTAVECNTDVIAVPITFPSGLAITVQLEYDHTNLMSYFNCSDTGTFSPQQIDIMRSLIETGRNGYDRRHLLGPALVWSGWFEVPGGALTDTSVAATDAGALVVLAKGLGQGIFQNNAGATVSGSELPWGDSWTELEGMGQTNVAPAVAAFDDRISAFVVGSTGLIFQNFTNTGELTFQPTWHEVPGNGRASWPPASVTFDNKLYVFVVGSTGLIYFNYANHGEAFQAQWFEVPGNGIAQGNPAAATFDNKLYAFVMGPTGLIYFNYANPGEAFQAQWFEVPGNGISITGPAAAALDEYLYVFVVGGDQRIYMNWTKAGNAFDYWMEVPGGGITDLAPTAVLFNDQLYLFATADSRIYVNSATGN